MQKAPTKPTAIERATSLQPLLSLCCPGLGPQLHHLLPGCIREIHEVKGERESLLVFSVVLPHARCQSLSGIPFPAPQLELGGHPVVARGLIKG